MRRNRILPCVIVIPVLLFLYLFHDPLSNVVSTTDKKLAIFRPRCDDQFLRYFTGGISGFRRCLHEKFDRSQKLFDDLPAIISKCLYKTQLREFELQALRNSKVEIKHVILPRVIGVNRSCTVVTLGIGNEIGTELSLREKLPHCKFYGADPILENGQVYRSVGQYFQVAVGSESGTKRQYVLKNNAYSWSDVTSASLPEFLSRYAKVDQIDYLFADAEGAEYKMFRQHLIGNLLFTICQIFVEMHGSLDIFGTNETEFKDLMSAILDKSSFVPVFCARLYGANRLLLINVHSVYCLEKYYGENFCG